jgi:hypothetical protein
MKHIALLIFFLISFDVLSAQKNLGFEEGANNWNLSGIVHIEKQAAVSGKYCAKIISGELSQKIFTTPFSIIEIHGKYKLNRTNSGANFFLRFYSNTGKLLLEYSNTLKFDSVYQSTGFYTEAPFGTKYFTFGMQHGNKGKSAIYAADFTVGLQAAEPILKTKPRCNIGEYLKPFWNSDTIYNESVLMVAENGKPATGNLLFEPAKIIAVTDFSGTALFSEKKDFIVDGNKIIATSGSGLPIAYDTFFDYKTNFSWYNIQGKWINITYTHTDKWLGPLAVSNTKLLPNTEKRLEAKMPLTIIAYGMSITRGLNVSSYDSVSPYMPTYAALFCNQLKEIFGYNKITLYNAGLPGAKIDWADKYAMNYINPVHPDLVILDFGMNDFWGCNPVAFAGHIQSIIQQVRRQYPRVEFIILSNMKFDPDYVLDSDPNKSYYLNNMIGYSRELHKMAAMGIEVVDMTSLSHYLYSRKKPKDCLANPLHPNDYMARWYAQVMLALFKGN